MPTIKLDSPIGDLDVPLLRRVVTHGEEVVVTVAHAERLLPQGIWVAVDDDAATIQAAIDAPATEEGATE